VHVSSIRRHEGYLMVDHRSTDGVADADVVKAGLPPGAGRGLFECATYTCSHCQRVVIVEPRRTRERAYCRKCDHIICDGCGVVAAQTKECKTFKAILDEQQEAVARAADGIIIAS
jgi:hypothetical protein